MIVRKSEYDALQRQHLHLRMQYQDLLSRWNTLVGQINAKGGAAFLNGDRAGARLFSEEDIKRLLILCHPDKHGGKRLAHEMTQRLLKLRDRA